jgi:hypothetical protein
MSDKQQYMYAVKGLNRHVNPMNFQITLAQLDDERPGDLMNPAVAEAMCIPPSKRGWRQSIIDTRNAVNQAQSDG